MSRTFRMSIAAGLALLAASAPANAQAPTPAAAPQQSVSVKDPTTARLLGIVPGAGHMYAGEIGPGLLYMGGTAVVGVMGFWVVFADCFNFVNDPCDHPWLPYAWVGTTLGVWGWSIYDAGHAAQRTNARRGLHVATFVTPAMMTSADARRVPAVRLGLTITTP